MLNYVIKAILNEDGSVAWQVNGNSVPVARLMAHQRAVQRIELATNGFIINDGETVKVSFFNPEKSLKVDEETMFKRDGLQEWFLSVPALVHNTPGEWEAQFFIVDESGNVMPSQKTVFVEYSSIKSAGIEMVTEDKVQELFNQATAAATTCEEIKEEILAGLGGSGGGSVGGKVYYSHNISFKFTSNMRECLIKVPTIYNSDPTPITADDLNKNADNFGYMRKSVDVGYSIQLVKFNFEIFPATPDNPEEVIVVGFHDSVGYADLTPTSDYIDEVKEL